VFQPRPLFYHFVNFALMSLDCSAAVLKSDDVRTALKTSAPGKSSDIDDLVLPGFDE